MGESKRLAAIGVVLVVFGLLWFMYRQSINELESPMPTSEETDSNVAARPIAQLESTTPAPSPEPIAIPATETGATEEPPTAPQPAPEPAPEVAPPLETDTEAEMTNPDTPPTVTVTGRVYDESDNVGMAGVDVFVRPLERDAAVQHTTTTDSTGNYTLDITGEGDYRIQVSEVPGYPQTTSFQGVQIIRLNASTSGDIPKDFPLKKGGVMTGIALLGDEPLANTVISFSEFSAGSTISIPDVTTDSEGRYRIEGLGEFTGSIQPRRTQANGSSQVALVVPVEIHYGEETEVMIDFAAGTSSIEGTVYFENTNTPIEASIAIYFGWEIEGEWIEEIIRARTDENGRYLAENLPAGIAEMHIFPRNVPNRIERIETVQLAEGQRVQKDIVITSVSIVATVTNIAADTKELFVVAHPGEVTVQMTNMAEFAQLRDTMVGVSQNRPGSGGTHVAELSGLNPGRYTITAMAWPATYSLATVQAYGYERLFADIRSKSVFVTVEPNDTEITLSLELPPR